jgi:hypothetical protein
MLGNDHFSMYKQFTHGCATSNIVQHISSTFTAARTYSQHSCFLESNVQLCRK